jgi:hypothetical protein
MNQNVHPFAGGASAANFQQCFYNPSNGTLNNGIGGSLTMSCAMPISGQSCAIRSTKFARRNVLGLVCGLHRICV